MPIGHLCQQCGKLHMPGEPRCRSKADTARRQAKPQRRVWHSRRWAAIRRYVAARDDYLCSTCGKPTPLTEGIADHIHGFRDEHDPRAWDTSKMQWLCKPCSGRKDAQARYQ